MKNTLKKLVSLLLVCTMLISLVPSVFAEEVTEAAEIVIEEVQEPVVEEPVVEEPAAEEPAAEPEPVVEEPVADEPVVEEPVADEPVVEEPVVEEPVVEEPVVEEPVVEEPVADEPVVEEPVVEEPVVDEPVVEEPVVEEPVVDEPVVDEPVVEEAIAHEYLVFDVTDEGWVVTGVTDPEIEEITVPSEFDGMPVVAIADEAFAGLEKVRLIVVEEGVITIGSAAFANCEELALVMLPASLEEMLPNALEGSVKASVSAPEGTYAATFIVEVELEEDEAALVEEVTEEEVVEDELILPEALPDAEEVTASLLLYAESESGMVTVAEGKKANVIAELTSVHESALTLMWSSSDTNVITVSGKGEKGTVTAKKGVIDETAEVIVEAVAKVKGDDGKVKNVVVATASIPVVVTAPVLNVNIEFAEGSPKILDLNAVDENGDFFGVVDLRAYTSTVAVTGDGEATTVKLPVEVVWKSSSAATADVWPYWEPMSEEGEGDWWNMGIVVPGEKAKAGTITITATAADGSGKKATIKVPVMAVLATAISLEENSNVVAVGKSLKLTPAFYPENATSKNLNWAVGTFDESTGEFTADTTYATISGGTLKTKKDGGVDVWVKAWLKEDESIASLPHKVSILPTAVNKVTVIGPKEMDVKDGEGDETKTTRVYAVVEPSTEDERQKKVNWTLAKAGVVAIVDEGFEGNEESEYYGCYYADLLPLTVGNASLSATSVDGTNKKATLSIKVANLATELVAPAGYQEALDEVDEDGQKINDKNNDGILEVQITAGQSLKVGVPTYLPANAVKPTIKWNVSNTTSETGVTYKGTDYLAPSNGTIKAKKLPAEDVTFIVSASTGNLNPILWEVRIKPVAASIAIGCTDANVAITEGKTPTAAIEVVEENLEYKFTATVVAADADKSTDEYTDETFTWTSSNKKVATIANDPDDPTQAILTVVGEGTTKLTVKGVTTKKSGTINVTVDAPITAFTLNKEASYRVTAGKTLQLNPATVTPSITADKVKWVVLPGAENEVKVTVSETGLVKVDSKAVPGFAASLYAYIGEKPDFDDPSYNLSDFVYEHQDKVIQVWPVDAKVKNPVAIVGEIVSEDLEFDAKGIATVDLKETVALTGIEKVTNPETSEVSNVPVVGTWKSSSTKVATVDAYGNVTLLTPGTAKITFTATSGANATVQLNVIRAIETIEIEPEWEVMIGKKQQLTAKITPADATEKLVWNTEVVVSEGEVAPITITAAGQVAPVKGVVGDEEGYVSFVPTYHGLTVQDATNGAEYVTVAIAKEFAGVEIRAWNGDAYSAPITTLVNDMNNDVKTFGLVAFELGEEEIGVENHLDVTWASSNKKVATIDAYGNVEILSAGSTNITATANNGSGKKATLKLTVVANANGIDAESEFEHILMVGKSVTLKVKATTDEGNTTKQNKFYWAVLEDEVRPFDENRPEVVTVSNGKVTAKAPGFAPVLAFVNEGEYNDFMKWYEEEFKNRPNVLSLTKDEIENQLTTNYYGAFATFNIFVYDVPTKVVVSDNAETMKTTSIKLNKYDESYQTLTLNYEVQNKFGDKGYLFGWVEDDNGGNNLIIDEPKLLDWTSSNDAAVAITDVSGNEDKGTVTLAINPEAKAGTTTITAATLDGSNKKATFKVTTFDGPSKMTIDADTDNWVKVVDDVSYAVVVGGEKLQMLAKAEPSTVKQTVKWTVEPKTVASISSNGILTTKPVNAETLAVVTATSTVDTSKFASMTVKIMPKSDVEMKLVEATGDNPAHIIHPGETITFKTGLYGKDNAALVIAQVTDYTVVDGIGYLDEEYNYHYSMVQLDEETDEVLIVLRGYEVGKAELTAWIEGDYTNADMVQVTVAGEVDTVEIERLDDMNYQQNGTTCEYEATVKAGNVVADNAQHVTWYLYGNDGTTLLASTELTENGEVPVVDDAYAWFVGEGLDKNAKTNVYDNKVIVEVALDHEINKDGENLYLKAVSDLNPAAADTYTIQLTAAPSNITLTGNDFYAENGFLLLDMDEGHTLSATAVVDPEHALADVKWTVKHPELGDEDLPTLEWAAEGNRSTVTVTAKTDSKIPFELTATAGKVVKNYDLFIIHPAGKLEMKIGEGEENVRNMVDSQLVKVSAEATRFDLVEPTALAHFWAAYDAEGNLMGDLVTYDENSESMVIKSGEVTEPTTVTVKVALCTYKITEDGEMVHKYEIISKTENVTIYPEAITSFTTDNSLSVSFDANQPDMAPELTVKVNAGACPYVIWGVDDSTILDVTDIVTDEAAGTSTAKIKGLKEGKTTITVLPDDNSNSKAKLTFTVEVIKKDYYFEPVTGGVKLTGIVPTAELGSKVTVDAMVGDAPVVALAEGLFAGRTEITEAELPVTVTEIPASLFEGCSNLETITLSDNVTVIGQKAFSGCTSLSNMVCKTK